jgi:predicted  nucleic acid-binding Zn-ribbon protein
MLQICQKDRVPSAVGLAACPECGHNEFWLQGQEPAAGERAPGEVAEQAAPAAVELTDTEKEADVQAAQARKPRTPRE